MQHLYATGFNAHSQLLLASGDEASTRHQTGDMHAFTRMASAQRIQVLDASWSQTVLRIDGGVHVRGQPLVPVRLSDAALANAAHHSPPVAPGGRTIALPPGMEVASPLSTHNGLQAFITRCSSDGAGSEPGGGRGDRVRAGDSRLVVVTADEEGNARLSSFPTSTVAGVCTSVAVNAAGIVGAAFVRDSAVEVRVQRDMAFADGEKDADEPRTGSAALTLHTFRDLAHLADHLTSRTGDSTTTEAPGENSAITPVASHAVPLPSVLRVPSSSVSLHATSTTFILTYSSASQPTTLLTTGDPRYPHSLGRRATRACPAETLGQVDALAGLRVGRVRSCAGGGLVAVVSEGGEGWIWGAVGGVGGGGGYASGVGEDDEGQEGVGLEMFGEVDEVGAVARVVLPRRMGREFEEGNGGGDAEDEVEVEVVDIAVGDGHAVVLDEKGSVWCCGVNEHGQLGRGAGRRRTGWKRVQLFEDLREQGSVVKSLHCGDLTSFVVVQED